MWNPFKNVGFFQLLKLLIKFSALLLAISKVLEFAYETLAPEWEKLKTKEDSENGELPK